MKNKILTIGIVALLILMIVSYSGVANEQINNKKEQIFKNEIPLYIRPGDLVFMELNNYSDKFPGWDHCGICIGDNEFVHASGYLHRVVKQNISFFETMDCEIVYGSVITSNESQRTNAVNFAKGQIGKPYNARHPKNQSFESESWYCSELVWASYLNQGIDLDRNGWKFPQYVGTLEICWDDDVKMYTDHELNNWYPGFFLHWLINYIIHWPKNHIP